MTTREKILTAIYGAIDEVNETLPADKKLKKTEDAVLVGKSGVLDSLGIVTLITATEQRVADGLGAAITLADESAMSGDDSPFKNVGALADFIAALLVGARV
jgi:acyl carrier protein